MVTCGTGQQAQQLKKKSFNVFCFQVSGSKQFLFALVRQPSFLKAESSENKEAVEQSKKRTEEQTKHKAELQNLRMQINRLRRKGEDTEDADESPASRSKRVQRRRQSALALGHVAKHGDESHPSAKSAAFDTATSSPGATWTRASCS